jgi:hypothetical protein
VMVKMSFTGENSEVRGVGSGACFDEKGWVGVRVYI